MIHKQKYITYKIWVLYRYIKYCNAHRCMKYHLASYTKFEQPDPTHYYRMIMCVVTKEWTLSGIEKTFCLQYLPYFTRLWMMIYLKSISNGTLLLICWTLGLIRMGARHLLPDLSGCLGTRGTRSNDGPVLRVWQISLFTCVSRSAVWQWRCRNVKKCHFSVKFHGGLAKF